MEHKHLRVRFYDYLISAPITNCLRYLFEMFIYTDSSGFFFVCFFLQMFSGVFF